jgi:curved DNA-binding protein CbpA
MAAWETPALIAWLRKIGPKVDSFPPFELLEISATDDVDAIRAAYQAIASTRHPDLFRGRLGNAESEQLLRVFAKISNAYATLRDPEERKKHGAKPKPKTATTPASGTPTAPTAPLPRKIAPRAMSHVRRADAALDAGDTAGAILHLRMAVAADPASRELRQLLADTEAKLKK